jgi:hypothetical protein
MLAAETTEGLSRLGVLHHTTLAESPEQKGCASHCTSSVGSRVVSYGAADLPRDLC